MKQSEVIVVGGGPTGMLTALGLARAGVAVTLLEGEKEIVRSPRAMIYHSAALQGLEQLGVLEDAERMGSQGTSVQLRVFATGEQFNFDQSDTHQGERFTHALHLGQDQLAGIALEHLRRLPNASVHYATRVNAVRQDASGVTVLAESDGVPREFRAGWVVGADGARSAVRESIGLKLEGSTWPDRFVATNVLYDFAEHGYRDATLQIDGRFGAIVATIDKKRNLWRCTYRESGDLPESGMLERMREWFQQMLPRHSQGYELVHYSPYRMHQRAVERMRVGRVLLAGDAAHLTNPTGGLGLTSGLFDLYVLYEALAAVIRGEAPESVLDTWADERLAAFSQIASPAATRLKRLLFDTSGAELEPHLARFRELAATPGGGRALFAVAKTLQSPSVLGR